MTAERVKVRPGQIWADNDKRSAGRRVRVTAVGSRYAEVEQVTGRFAEGSGRRTRILIDRMRPTATGYRLVADVSDDPPVAQVAETETQPNGQQG